MSKQRYKAQVSYASGTPAGKGDNDAILQKVLCHRANAHVALHHGGGGEAQATDGRSLAHCAECGGAAPAGAGEAADGGPGGGGQSTPSATNAALEKAAQEPDEAKAVRAVQAALDPDCLLMVHINPESRVQVAHRAVKPELVEEGWRTFLIKVQNEAGVTAPLRLASPNALPAFHRDGDPKMLGRPEEARARKRIDGCRWSRTMLRPWRRTERAGA